MKKSNFGGRELRLSEEENTNGRNNSVGKSMSNAVKNNVGKNNSVGNKVSKGAVQQSPPKNKLKNDKLRPGPIERVDPKASPVSRGNQKRPNSEYNSVRDLFVGMENFVVLVRVLFVHPMKNFINKKGVESQLFSIEVGDHSGATIDCTMFGETAQRF